MNSRLACNADVTPENRSRYLQHVKPGFLYRHKHKHILKTNDKTKKSSEACEHKHRHEHKYKTANISYDRTKANSKENFSWFVFVNLQGKVIL